ncbi:MAG: hypothetical protein K2X55_21920 [Burkholderiaceae bacterium]|nr:hypothetical protein [Burkholderiaceae bacterium]
MEREKLVVKWFCKVAANLRPVVRGEAAGLQMAIFMRALPPGISPFCRVKKGSNV